MFYTFILSTYLYNSAQVRLTINKTNSKCVRLEVQFQRLKMAYAEDEPEPERKGWNFNGT